MKIILVVLTSVISFSVTSYAANRVNQRQHNQRARIAEGVRSGDLTKQEATRLRKQQQRIRTVERKANADGTVTAQEAAHMEKMQDRASKSINRKKHNQRIR